MSIPTIEDLEAARDDWFAAVEAANLAQARYAKLVYALARENNTRPLASPDEWRDYAAAKKAESEAERERVVDRTAALYPTKAISQESRETSCSHIADWLRRQRESRQTENPSPKETPK